MGDDNAISKVLLMGISSANDYLNQLGWCSKNGDVDSCIIGKNVASSNQ